MAYTLQKFDDTPAFRDAAASFLAFRLRGSVVRRGRAVLGLSGGTTPGPVYELLGQANIDWTKVHIFLVDERYVPPNHPESNARLLRNTLLRFASVPDGNLHVPDTSLPVGRC